MTQQHALGLLAYLASQSAACQTSTSAAAAATMGTGDIFLHRHALHDDEEDGNADVRAAAPVPSRARVSIEAAEPVPEMTPDVSGPLHAPLSPNPNVQQAASAIGPSNGTTANSEALQPDITTAGLFAAAAVSPSDASEHCHDNGAGATSAGQPGSHSRDSSSSAHKACPKNVVRVMVPQLSEPHSAVLSPHLTACTSPAACDMDPSLVAATDTLHHEEAVSGSGACTICIWAAALCAVIPACSFAAVYRVPGLSRADSSWGCTTPCTVSLSHLRAA